MSQSLARTSLFFVISSYLSLDCKFYSKSLSPTSKDLDVPVPSIDCP